MTNDLYQYLMLDDYEYDQNGEPRMYEFDGKLYSQTEAIEAGLMTGGIL